MTFSQADLDHKYTSSTLALLKPEEIAIKIQIAVLYPKKIKNYFKVFSKQIARLVKNGGTGLGLYISKQLAFDGSVLSTLNQGSTGVLIPLVTIRPTSKN
jgi:signal transduction histidine kinase